MTTTPGTISVDKRPPAGNEVIARIMAEHKVGRKRAYTILRKERSAQFTSEIPENQRAQVLHILVAHEDVHDVPAITNALHAIGTRIDMHDVTKTLWALQKTRFVRFREHQGRDLYAIRVTNEGFAAHAEMMERYNGVLRKVEPDVAQVADQITAEAARKRDEEEAKAAMGEATMVLEPYLEQAVADAELDAAEEAHTVKPSTLELPEFVAERVPEQLAEQLDVRTDVIARPWFKGNLGGWPAIRDLRDRAVKAEKINAAIKLLEQVGEDETAIQLMGKTEFTPLEEEVIALLRQWKEL